MKKTADQAHENMRPAARAGNTSALAKVENKKIEEDSSFIDFSKEKPVKKETKPADIPVRHTSRNEGPKKKKSALPVVFAILGILVVAGVIFGVLYFNSECALLVLQCRQCILPHLQLFVEVVERSLIVLKLNCHCALELSVPVFIY